MIMAVLKIFYCSIFIILGCTGYSMSLTCVPRDHPALVIVDYNLDDVVYYNILTRDMHRCNITGIINPRDVAVDSREEVMFISNYGTTSYEGFILRMSVDGSKTNVIADSVVAPQPYGLAVDTVNQHVYYGDYYFKSIIRMDYDGNNAKSIINSGLRYPYKIAVDEVNKRLYWSDINSQVIESSSFDGSDRVILVSNVQIHGLTLDRPACEGLIYFSAINSRTFESVSTSGNDRKILSRVTKYSSRWNGLTVYADNVYLIDSYSWSGEGRLRVVSRSGGNISIISEDILSNPLGMALYLPPGNKPTCPPATTESNSQTTVQPVADAEASDALASNSDESGNNTTILVLSIVLAIMCVALVVFVVTHLWLWSRMSKRMVRNQVYEVPPKKYDDEATGGGPYTKVSFQKNDYGQTNKGFQNNKNQKTDDAVYDNI